MNDIELSYHISQVYQLITWFIGAFTFGSYVSTCLLNYSFFVTILSFVVSVGSIAMFANSRTDLSKFSYGMIIAGSVGISSGGLITIVNDVDQTILPLSMLTTLGIFVSMSVVSKYVTNSQMLLLGGFLSSALSGLCVVGIISLFLPIPMIFFDIRVIISFITFCGYVVYDTFKMRQKFQSGVIDYYEHALMLFLDIINIFTDLLIILIRNKDRKDSKRKSK